MSEQSKRFEGDVGTWDGDVEVRPYPGADVQRSTGVMVNRRVGTWLVSDFENATGFEGHGIYGWDQAKQAYVGTWIDDARGSLVIGAGTLEGATMTYRYELATAERTMRWHDVHEVIDADTRLFRSFYELPSGEAHEVVTARYRRRR